MNNEDRWTESKFKEKANKIHASRNRHEVAVGSRIIVDAIGEFYSSSLRKYVQGHLLDLGCGKVPLYAAYKERAKSVTCVDWQQSLHGADFLDHCMDLTKPLNFTDGSFDTIILSDVLEHIPNPLELLSEIYRILKDGGVLIGNVPFYYWIHESPHDYYRYTRYALERFSNCSNFKVIELLELGGLPEVASDLFLKGLSSIRGLSKVPMLLEPVISMGLRTKLSRHVSFKTQHTFPLGYGFVYRKK